MRGPWSWVESGVRAGALAVVALMASGCTTTGLLLGAAGVATDTSVTWDIVKHVHAKLTEGDDIPCRRLDSVQRALNVRCGAFEAGSVRVADLRAPSLQGCVLAVAVGEPRFWPALPEFIAKGASPEACERSPLVDLAQAQACPAFDTASPEVRAALRWLAEADSRAVHHDVMRMLSCPAARRAGLDAVLDTWLAQGALEPGAIGFGALGALHPGALDTPFSQRLEARGHTARAGIGGFDGTLPQGFELALRDSDWRALDWWLARAPELANRVPAARAGQLPWVPLARVLAPNFLSHPGGRADTVAYLLARGADPWRTLPYDSGVSVVQQARRMNSPELGLLERTVASGAPVTAGE